MKNIHLLPTDKPSRLIFQHSQLFLSFYMEENEGFSEFNQHIYITNSEEIKEGDWCIYNSGEVIQYLVKVNTDNLKKIILTTDQDLINDGIQAIDDEFLEWFCKNPSCEFVEVEDWYNKYLSCCRSKEECYCNKKRIIIPIEPKQEPTIIDDWLAEHGDPEIYKKVEKQLELEEAAEKYATTNKTYSEQSELDFKAGAYWQQERMYSEEEVLNLLINFNKHTLRLQSLKLGNSFNVNDWFEQFKK